MRTHNLHRARKTQPTVPPYLRRLVFVIAIADPLMTIPQTWQIWSTHQTAGVSILTWSIYIIAAAIWLVYGLKIKDKPIIVSSFLWVVMESSVVIGLLLYR